MAHAIIVCRTLHLVQISHSVVQTVSGAPSLTFNIVKVSLNKMSKCINPKPVDFRIDNYIF